MPSTHPPNHSSWTTIHFSSSFDNRSRTTNDFLSNLRQSRLRQIHLSTDQILLEEERREDLAEVVRGLFDLGGIEVSGIELSYEGMIEYMRDGIGLGLGGNGEGGSGSVGRERVQVAPIARTVSGPGPVRVRRVQTRAFEQGSGTGVRAPMTRAVLRASLQEQSERLNQEEERSDRENVELQERSERADREEAAQAVRRTNIQEQSERLDRELAEIRERLDAVVRQHESE